MRASYHTKSSALLRILRGLGRVLPGDRLKTLVYLKLVYAPRRALRRALFEFYRYDHVYEVLREFRSTCSGPFAVLEFGTSAGYSFVKLLYATQYLGMSESVTVHGFDSFEGLPETTDPRDSDLSLDGGRWVAGSYRGDFQRLHDACASRFGNFQLHKGDFAATLTPQLLSSFTQNQPILVWIDADFYTSARTVMERLTPLLPSGCVIYFDELNTTNYGSRLTGEARLVHEINSGLLGGDVDLVLD
ncbi:MAG: class I SAM-dependent methyltransferase, partial [Terriglobales bacterium]